METLLNYWGSLLFIFSAWLSDYGPNQDPPKTVAQAIWILNKKFWYCFENKFIKYMFENVLIFLLRFRLFVFFYLIDNRNKVIRGKVYWKSELN